MSLKCVFFLGLIAISAIEANHILKSLQTKHFSTFLQSRLPHTLPDHLSRKRRDTEDGSIEIADELEFENYLTAARWSGDKYTILAEFLQLFSLPGNNLTLIAWQRICDEHGNAQEIRTIQLIIPPKPQDPDAPTNIVEDEEEEDDEDEDEKFLPHDLIKEMRQSFEPADEEGVFASMSVEGYDEDGGNPKILYLDTDELFFQYEGFSVYNKTQIASSQKEVSDFIAARKPTCFGKPTVLSYDVDCKLIPEKSHITPEFLGAVLDHYEATDELLLEAPKVIAEIAYTYPQEEIPKQLALYYNKNHPDYKWKVLVDPEHAYIVKEVAITLSYDNADFDEQSDISYLVYGSKRTSKK